MPRYELMYILASSVSDDIVPETTAQIEQQVADFGGTDIKHELLGKKKLAYTIKKTRNGHYGVINFEMPAAKVNTFEAKIRTQKNTIIRSLIINLEDHIARSGKDEVAQAKMVKNRPVKMEDEKTSNEPKEAGSAKLDEKIEKALSEDLI